MNACTHARMHVHADTHARTARLGTAQHGTACTRARVRACTCAYACTYVGDELMVHIMPGEDEEDSQHNAVVGLVQPCDD